MNTKKKKLPIYAYLVIFLLISHVVGILSLIKATRQGDTDLVSKDYYSHSVHYQQEIDAFRRCREFKRQPNIELNTQELKIRFPEGSKITEGQLVFYHPSASNKDQVIDLKLKDKETKLSYQKINSGSCELTIKWLQDGKLHCYKEKLFVPTLTSTNVDVRTPGEKENNTTNEDIRAPEENNG